MVPLLEGSDAVIHEACGTAPHHHVAALQPQTAYWTAAALPAPQEHGRQAQGYGNDGRPGVLLVAVLMEAEFGSREVAIDQAGVGIVSGETCLGGGARGQVEESRWHRRPRGPCVWI